MLTRVQEVMVVDLAQSLIEQIPVDEITKVRRSMGPPPEGSKYVYVRIVTLSNVKANTLTEINANANGVVGPAIGIGGKVYNKSVSDQNNYVITVEAPDVDFVIGSG